MEHITELLTQLEACATPEALETRYQKYLGKK